jgi:pilus assembly protein CpaE
MAIFSEPRTDAPVSAMRRAMLRMQATPTPVAYGSAAARARGPSLDAGSANGLERGRLPGGLVALCGLAGGAGTTTLAYLLAAQAARESHTPVLLCEAEATLGGLTTVTGRASAMGLGGLADLEIDQGLPEQLPTVDLGRGLRLLASSPRSSPVVAPAALAAVLEQARATHPLVVVDCRTVDHPQAAFLLASASHILWTLPMTTSAIRSVEMLTAYGALPRPVAAREALVAIGTRAVTADVTVRDLRALADERHERLVLIPHIEELQHAGELEESEAMLSAITQIGTFLRRPR